MEQLGDKVEDWQALCQVAQDELRAIRAENAQLREQLAEREAQIANLKEWNREYKTQMSALLAERGDMIAELKEQLGQKTGEAFGLQVEVRELKEQLAASQEGNRMLLERLRKLYALLREFREHASEIIFENETS